MSAAGRSAPIDQPIWGRLAVILGAAAICVAGGALDADGGLRPPPAVAYALAAASSAVLLARLRLPVTTMVLTTIGGMAVVPLGLLMTPLAVAPAVVGAWTVGVRCGRAVTVVALGACAVALVAPAVAIERATSWEDASRLASVAAALGVAGLLGRAARQRHSYLELVEERARSAERDREIEAQQRVAAERLRIARELHDLVAHQVTLAHAQAAVAARLFDTRPDDARENIDRVETTTRTALDELRAAVGLLRQDREGPVPAEPAPGLAQLPALTEAFERAGLRVAVTEDGAQRALSPAIDTTAYRVIQEALTNVSKHSASTRAAVGMSWLPDSLMITVTDAGPARPRTTDHEPGYGVLGMRERVAAFHGEFSAEPRPGGGFVVTARLPLAPGERG